MKATVKIIIDKSKGDIFTNYDTVTGKVILQVFESLIVSKIEVKLEGISKSRVDSDPPCLVLGDNANCVSDADSTVNKHELLSESITVFPPSRERQLMTCSEFTLAEGTYLYPFSFKLPMNNDCSLDFKKSKLLDPLPECYWKVADHGSIGCGRTTNGISTNLKKVALTHKHLALPPTFLTGNIAKVKYQVKVLVSRGNHLLAFDLMAKDKFKFSPLSLKSVPERRQNNYGVREFFSLSANGDEKSRYYFNFKIDSPYLSPGKPILSKLYFGFEKYDVKAKIPTIYITHIKMALVSVTDTSVVDPGITGRTLHKMRGTERILLADSNTNMYALQEAYSSRPQHLGTILVPSEFAACVLPHSVAPTFETCNITQSYRVEVTITYTLNAKPRTGFFAHFPSSSPQKLKLMSEEITIDSATYPKCEPQSEVVLTVSHHKIKDEPLPLYREAEEVTAE